jgi:hypothetical protein
MKGDTRAMTEEPTRRTTRPGLGEPVASPPDTEPAVEPLEVRGRPLSAIARNYIRQHALNSQDELPPWAFRDLLWVLDACELLEHQLAETRGRLEELTSQVEEYYGQRAYAERLAAQATSTLARLLGRSG